MSKSQRIKGLRFEQIIAQDFRAFEQNIAQDFRAIGFPDALRALEYQAGMGIDLQGTSPFSVQCKAHHDYVSISTIDEIPVQEGRIRVLVTKGDRKEPMAVLSWKDLQKLIERSYGDIISHLTSA